MASALSQPDLFTMPSRLFIRDTKRFASALSSNFADRMLVDAGQFSEALSCLALYTEWLERRKRVSSISIGRAHSVDITVADICRTLCARGVLKLPDSTAQELIELQSWAKNLHVSGAMGGARRLLLRRNPDVLSFVLGVAAAPNYLKGQVALSPSLSPHFRSIPFPLSALLSPSPPLPLPPLSLFLPVFISLT